MWWHHSNSNRSLRLFLESRDQSMSSLLETLLAIADDAANLARQFYIRADMLDVTHKGDSTPLTDADTALHHLICERLNNLSLGIPILSEESATAEIADRLSWGTCWVVDPLDGTKEFIEKTDQFTINIALIVDGLAELGLISIPCRREHWLGVVDNGAAIFPERAGLEGQPVSTQLRDPLKPLVMLASHRHAPRRVEQLIESLTPQFGDIKRLNSGSAVKFCDVACGRADVYPRTSACSEWDVAAGDALVTAAGGRVTNLKGERIQYNRRVSLLSEPFVAAGDGRLDYARIIDESLNM
jgi:3'(2'), 5'-bisphosphate nucleotidase